MPTTRLGYRLLSQEDAQDLPHNHAALGMDIETAQRITDGGMTFDLIRVKQVRPGSPGERAGFHPGDEIIAIDDEVFSSLAVFAAYVGSVPPGSQVNVDYIPSGGGPQQAQRIGVTVGMAGETPQPASPDRPDHSARDRPVDWNKGCNRRGCRGALWMLRARLFL